MPSLKTNTAYATLGINDIIINKQTVNKILKKFNATSPSEKARIRSRIKAKKVIVRRGFQAEISQELLQTPFVRLD